MSRAPRRPSPAAVRPVPSPGGAAPARPAPRSTRAWASAGRPPLAAAIGPVLAATALALAVAPAAEATPTGEPVKIAGGLNTPWELALAPDGRTFVTERDGGIRVLSATDVVQPGNVLDRAVFPNVRKLLGLALAPDYAASRTAYVYVSTSADPDGAGPANGTNGIWRIKEGQDGNFTVESRVFDGIASDGNHDGGRMAFGPDGHLYVTTGDIHQPTRPQDKQSLNGKILRFSVPATGALGASADNPFLGEGGNARFVWSFGHRHPQGLAFDAAGRLWETEHGPTGETHGADYPGGDGKQGRDELNLIAKGANYGWPVVSGTDNRPGMTAPAAVAPDSPAWAPGDVAVGADGSLYAPFLAGQRLHRFDVRTGVVFGQADHGQGLGRLRVAVARGTDLLFTQDGADAGVYRLPLSAPTPGGSDAADPLAVPPITSPPTTGPPTTPVAGAGVPSAADAARMRSRARALALKVRSAVKALGRRRLEAGRTVSVRLAGPSAGRTTIELRLRSSRGALLARSTTRTRSSAAQRYRVKLGTTGRRRLKATSQRTIAVRLVHRPATGKAFSTSFVTRVAARRR